MDLLNIVATKDENFTKNTKKIEELNNKKRYILRYNEEIEILEQSDTMVVYRDNEGYKTTTTLNELEKKINQVKVTDEAKEKVQKKAKEIFDKITEEIKERYERHEYIKKNGCSDPNWSDGDNMNLVRNHIISYKQRMKNLSEMYGFELPKIYDKPLPEEVSAEYMAKKEYLEDFSYRMLELIAENIELIETGEQYVSMFKDKENKELGRIDKLIKEIQRKEYWLNGTLVNIRMINNAGEDCIPNLLKELKESIEVFREKYSKNNIIVDEDNETIIEYYQHENGQMSFI